MEATTINNYCKLLAVTIFIFLAFSACFYSEQYVFAQAPQSDQPPSKLKAASNTLEQAFNAVSAAEKEGANVNCLISQLNSAADLLAKSENAYRTGDNNAASNDVNAVLLIAQQVKTQALAARESAALASQNSFWSTIVFTLVGSFVFVFSLFLVWRRLRKSHIKNLYGLKPMVNT